MWKVDVVFDEESEVFGFSEKGRVGGDYIYLSFVRLAFFRCSFKFGVVWGCESL